VRDLRRGFSVCSGDLLMLELARAFRPDRAIFAADVDGLFQRGSEAPIESGPIGAVSQADLGKIEFSSARRTDVTGSIEGKVRSLFEIAEACRRMHDRQTVM